MELTRKQVIEELEKADSTVYKEPKTKMAQALEYAISSLKTDEAYQIIYEGGEIFTKADMVELIKALNYDRNQYDKGYTDAEKKTDFILHWMTDFLDAPCNYDYAGGFSISNFMLEDGGDWCGDHCDSNNHYQCWKKFFELYQNYINEWGNKPCGSNITMHFTTQLR